MNRKTAILCGLLAVLICAALIGPYAQAQFTKPTDEQKRQMDELIKRSESYKEGYDRCKKNEEAARAAGDTELADLWSSLADLWADLLDLIRELIIDLVDSYYNIGAPPNTTIEYDPDSTDYGYTSGSKDAIKVVLCPQAFSDGPGLVASTKIHELRHAWQIFWCWSDFDGYWDDCTFWGHLSEGDSYNEEEKAYDSCVTSDMPAEEKELIRKRIKEHLKAALDALFGGWLTDLFRALPGSFFNYPFTIYNATAVPDVVQVQVNDELGWPIFPPGQTIPVGAESVAHGSVMVQIPPGVEPATIDRLNLTATSMNNPTVSFTDAGFVVATATVDVTAGPGVAGSPGDTIPIEFVPLNLASVADVAVCQFSSTSGWPVNPPVILVPLPPGGSMSVFPQVTIPIGAPDWALDTVVCNVSSQADPTQTDKAWVPVQVQEIDLAAMATLVPLGTLAQNTVVIPRVGCLNTGHLSADFNLTLTVKRQDGSVFWTDVAHVPPIAPGEYIETELLPLALTSSGTFTTVAQTSHPQDADPANDQVTGTFTVQGTVGCALACVPASGTVPFVTNFTATMTNHYTGQLRRLAGRIDVWTASGQFFSNWRSGFTNIAPGGTFVTNWNQPIPALASLIGANRFHLLASDVTPSPFNQPPYPPSGDTDTAETTLFANAP